MPAEPWDRLEELFTRAVEMAPADRERFLAEACRDDAELRRELDSLLEMDREAGYLDRAPAPPSREDPGAEEGRRIGPYRIVRRLGTGGMSAVYLAVRDDGQYRQDVAIKLIRRGLDTDQILGRFRRERQILAGLQHSNIARLLDGGSTEDGRPYIVMEFIDGLDVREYCDRHRLSITARLQLFRVVCSAVHYAHRNLVVHRDLKPGNMLVTAEGVPKLLDFGIARLLGPGPSSATLDATSAAVRLMTPRYASPEQVRGEPLTTASDVYSLGVVLYELLSGHLPYPVDGLELAAIERAICSSEPPPPSVAAGRVEEDAGAGDGAMVLTPEAVSSTREGSPEALRRRLSGDLDNIVRKAMRKEPDRRYSSTEELAQDIERHLKRMPVLARPDTFRYRAGKFVRRHTVAVAASGLALLSLVAGILATAHQARMARMERARAEQVSAFLTDLFEVSDPSEARGSRVTAREILDQGAARIDRELQGQPQARAALSDTIGTAYLRLGLLDRATPHLERALEIRRRLLGRHPDVALSLEHVAELRAWKGDYAAAERLHREGLALRRETLGPDDPQVAESASLLAGVLYERGDARGAEVLAREALLLRRRSYGENHQLVAETLHNLAKALYAQGDYDGAEALFREALAISRQASEDDPETATNLVSLAAVLNQKGEYDAAETLLKEALSLQRRVLGEDHPDVAAALHALGLSLLRRGALEEAGAALRRSLDLRRKLQGEDHPEAARVSGTLALTLIEQGRLDDAGPLLRRALASQGKELGEDHPWVLDLRLAEGLYLHEKGDDDEAEAVFREALTRRQQRFGSEHPDLARHLYGLATVVLARGGDAEAVVLLGRALALQERYLGRGHPDVGLSLVRLAEALGPGETEERERLARESLAIIRRVRPEGHPHAAQPLVVLGLAAVARGEARAAEPLLREAVETLGRTRPPQDWRVAVAESALGHCVGAQRRYAEAEALLDRSHRALERQRGPGSRETRRALARLISLYDSWGRRTAADRLRAREAAFAPPRP